MVEYKHGLSKGLLRALVKFARGGQDVVNLNDCKMNLSQRTNFYKLKYWGLVVKASTNERGGEWRMTLTGWQYVRGEIPLHKYVWSYRGNVMRYEGQQFYIQDITDGWKYRPEYAREAQPHQEPGQESLL